MLNIEQLKQRIADYAHVDYHDAERFVDSLLHLVKERLDAGEEVEIQGLGHFSVVDPQNEDLRRYAFVPDEKMRDAVNAPFNCFEPVVIGRPEPYKENLAMTKEDDIMEAADNNPVPVLEEAGKEPAPAVSETLATAEDVPAEPAPVPIAEAGTDKMAPSVDNDEDPEDDESDTLEEVKLKDGKTPWLLYILIAGALVVLGYLLRLYFDYTNQNDWASPEVTHVADTIKEKTVTEAVQADTLRLEEDSAAAVQQDTLSVADGKAVIGVDVTPTAAADAEPQLAADAEPQLAKEEKPMPAKEEKPKPVENRPANHYKLGEDGKPVTVTLQPGERLTIIALREYGDKSFWPYIYDVNSDKLTNPNNVPVGVVLKLPDPLFYGIDASNPASVSKAKNRAAQLLKK